MRFVFAALLLVLAALAPAAETAGLSGEWKVYSNIQGHESNFECTFTQTGQNLTGTCRTADVKLEITGKVEEKKLIFQYKTAYEGQELTVIHTGTIASAGKIAGAVDVDPMGVSGEFTATQVK